MRTDPRAEPLPSAPPRVYKRRRLALALAVLGGLVVTLTGCRAVLSWLSDETADPAAASVNAPTLAVVAADPACPTDGPLFGEADEQVPADLRADIDRLLAHDAVQLRQVSLSVWVDGWGEVAALEPDLALKPASNQKILTAVGALDVLDHDEVFETRLLATAPIEAGRVDGDLLLVGGGDPVLWDVGEHSIYTLATTFRDLGVVEVTGGVYVDDSRYDARRMAAGWTDQQIPGDATPISALTVATNRLDDTYEYLADPASGNGQVFVRYLEEVGITVGGGFAGNEPIEAPVELAALSSPTVAQLVDMMMRNSDNTTAELLLKEIGLRATGDGSTAAGIEASRQVVESWCLELAGKDDDGSGLSYANERSAREWRLMLQGAQTEQWWPVFHESLPVAGDPDATLPNRLNGPATGGNLRAKTGTIDVARALSGVFTTVGGRQATFSVIINDGHDPEAAITPTDELLETVAAHPG